MVTPKQFRKRRALGLEECRQEVAVAQMDLVIGNHSRNLEWAYLVANEAVDMGNSPKFWKNQNQGTKNETKSVSDSISVSVESTFDGAVEIYDNCLSTLYLQAYRQKFKQDWSGLFTTWINMGMFVFTWSYPDF